MTQLENKKLEKIANKLQNEGLSVKEWKIIIELRKKRLISRGENPAHWWLELRRCSKKAEFK